MQNFTNRESTPLPEYLQYDAQGTDHFALKINDDSMAPALPAGCTVVIRRTGEVYDGDIVLVMYGGKVLLRRIQGDPFGNLCLICDASEDDEDGIFIRSTETDSLICFGRVVDILK